jgi:hypothetical protein
MSLCGVKNLRNAAEYRCCASSFRSQSAAQFSWRVPPINALFLGVNSRFRAVSKPVLKAFELSPNGDVFLRFFTVSDALLGLSRTKSGRLEPSQGSGRSGSLDA